MCRALGMFISPWIHPSTTHSSHVLSRVWRAPPAALVLAADVGRLESVELLLSKGADPAMMSQNGWTPLMASSAKGHLLIVERLLKVPGLDVNRVNEHGITALWNACNRGRTAVVSTLLAAGADPTLAVGKGKTPLKVRVVCVGGRAWPRGRRGVCVCRSPLI